MVTPTCNENLSFTSSRNTDAQYATTREQGPNSTLVVLIKLRWPDASPQCQPADCLSVGALWARPHDQDQLCRVRTRSSVGVWVGRSRVDVSCTRPAVHGGLATHRVRVPPGQPELPGGHRLRPGWGHKSRQKMC